MIMGLQTEGTHQIATLQFKTCLGIFKQERKPKANIEVIPHCRGNQGSIDKSHDIAKDAKVVGREIKSISCTYCTLDPQFVCWSPQMHNIFVHMQMHIQIGNLFVVADCTQKKPQH